MTMPDDTDPLPTNLLEAFLSRRDVPCPGCGYNLRGLASNRCPECNQGLEIGVKLVDAAWGTLVGTIVALSIVAGTAGIMLMMVTIMMIYKGGGPNQGFEVFMIIVYPAMALPSAGIPALWLARTRGRSWFRSQVPDRRRRLLKGAIAAAAAIVFGWFGLMIAFA